MKIKIYQLQKIYAENYFILFEKDIKWLISFINDYFEYHKNIITNISDFSKYKEELEIFLLFS